MYLRAREDPAKLRVALASAFVLGRGRLSPAAVALGSGQRWGEKAGSARGYIGQPVGEIGKGSGQIGAKRVAFQLWATARWPSIRERHHRRQGRKEQREEEGKATTGGSRGAVRERADGRGDESRASGAVGRCAELGHARCGPVC